MKRQDLIRHLESHGCFLLREGGLHSIYVNPASNRTSAVPRHHENLEGLDIVPIKVKLKQAILGIATDRNPEHADAFVAHSPNEVFEIPLEWPVDLNSRG